MPKTASASIEDLIGTPVSATSDSVTASTPADTDSQEETSSKKPITKTAAAKAAKAESTDEAESSGESSSEGSAVRDIPVAPLRPRITRAAAQSTPSNGNGNGNYSNNNYTNNGNGNGRQMNRGYDRYNNNRENDRANDRSGRYSNEQRGNNRDDRNNSGAYYDEPMPVYSDKDTPTVTLKGILDTSRDGHGVLRAGFAFSERDAYISTSQIRRFKLRPGDLIEGPGREPKENERYWGLLKVDVVNGQKAEDLMEIDRVRFQSLTPVYPDSQIKLETGEEPLSLRIIDLIAPIGKGQRSLIVSPPKAGKTTLLKDIATGIAQNHPEMHVMAVLVGERPEEVTDIRRHIERITKGKGEVAASNFDEPAEDQCRVAELAIERAKRLVEMGQDVVILLDSITRLARAYNLSIPTSGRTLSGGFDPAALFPPKKFFGAARNFEVAGSLTIIGTALVDTGSRMDDLIYEEFKGTGNQEVTLDRRLAERRIYPAIDVQRSGTRRDDLLVDPMTYQALMTLQRMLDTLDKEERTVTLVEQLKRSKTNKDFLASLKAA